MRILALIEPTQKTLMISPVWLRILPLKSSFTSHHPGDRSPLPFGLSSHVVFIRELAGFDRRLTR